MVRAALLVLGVALSLVCPVGGEEMVDPPGLRELYRAAEDYGVEPEQDLSQGIEGLLRRGLEELKEITMTAFPTGARLLAVALLCALAHTGGENLGRGGLQPAEMAGALAVTALAAGDMGAMVGLGRQTVERMDQFSNLLLPVMAVLTAATGQVGRGTITQGLTVLFGDLLLTGMDMLLLPLVYAYIGACFAWGAVGGQGLKRIAALLRSLVQGLLIAVLVVFVGWLTASGAIAGSADAAAVKTAKMAISRAVPVVGGILADASETVLVGAGLLRGAVGTVGMVTVLTICLAPFLRLSAHYLIYKGVAALAGMVSDMRLNTLIDDIGSAFGLVLGITGACALVLLVSVAAGITAVVS